MAISLRLVRRAHAKRKPVHQEASIHREVLWRNNRTTTTSPKLKRKQYEKKCAGCRRNFVISQEWVKAEGRRIMLVFEGRDGAGRGTIKAITERVSPRVFRVVSSARLRQTARSRGCSHPALYGAFSSGGGDHHF